MAKYKAHIPTEEKKCVTCGIDRGRGKKYCSRKCYNEIRKGTYPPGAFKKGNIPVNPFKKGQTPWNKGKPFIHRASWEKGHPDLVPKEARLRQSKTMTGSGNHQWKGGITTPERLRWHCGRYRARKLNSDGSHTLKEWGELKKKYNYMCLCCKKYEPEIRLSEDHIIPLTMGGSDYINNIQPLCHSCNSRKNNKIINYTIQNYG